MYDFNRFLRISGYPGRVAVGPHQREEMFLVGSDGAVQPLDLDKRRPAIVAAEQQVAEPGGKPLHAAEMNQDVLVQRRIIDALALPVIPGIGSEYDAMRG